ncbi:MAG TPA: hypothetical protein VJ717_03435 [Gemmatimonadaceae bacterium]|nr:hypothetical protein [Gemmatimonadaceae bacterium]
MVLPEKVNARWIATLENDQLLEAEGLLHAAFLREETAEKRRRGPHYTMLRGPETLVTAWHRWLLVSNATRTRGILVHRHAHSVA